MFCTGRASLLSSGRSNPACINNPFNAGVFAGSQQGARTPKEDILWALSSNSEENSFVPYKQMLCVGHALSLVPELDGDFPPLCWWHGRSNCCNSWFLSHALKKKEERKKRRRKKFPTGANPDGRALFCIESNCLLSVNQSLQLGANATLESFCQKWFGGTVIEMLCSLAWAVLLGWAHLRRTLLSYPHPSWETQLCRSARCSRRALK